jgi:hypothetical protein
MCHSKRFSELTKLKNKVSLYKDHSSKIQFFCLNCNWLVLLGTFLPATSSSLPHSLTTQSLHAWCMVGGGPHVCVFIWANPWCGVVGLWGCWWWLWSGRRPVLFSHIPGFISIIFFQSSSSLLFGSLKFGHLTLPL